MLMVQILIAHPRDNNVNGCETRPVDAAAVVTPGSYDVITEVSAPGHHVRRLGLGIFFVCSVFLATRMSDADDALFQSRSC